MPRAGKPAGPRVRLEVMEEPAVVPADREEAPATTRPRRLGALVGALAGVAALAVLSGTLPRTGDGSGQAGELPPPQVSFTTTTDGDHVPSLAGEWIPTWFPGEGRFDAVARSPGGGWVLAQVSNRGGTSTTLWRSPDGSTWEMLTSVEGTVTGLAPGPEGGVIAVGAVVDGDPFREALVTSPTVWLVDESGIHPLAIELPGGSGVVADVVTTQGVLVAVGWTGQAMLWPELSPTPDPFNEPAAWWSVDGTRWQPAEIDTEGLVGGAMASAAAGPELMVAGGAGSGSARLWESMDVGRTWQLAEGDQVWPVGQVFRSVAATVDDAMAVSATLDPDTPRATLWRRGPEGWERAETDGIQERIVTEVATIGDELVAISAGPFETSARMWASADGQTWEPIGLPDPCASCSLAGFSGPRLRIGAATPDLVVGAAQGQPVLWSRRPGEVRLQVAAEIWRRVELEAPDDVYFVVYHSTGLTVAQGERGIRVLVEGEPVQPRWGPTTPGQVVQVLRVDDRWYLSGWSDGITPKVWVSADGVNWTVVAEAREPVAPLLVVDDASRPVVVGIGPVAITDVETVDVETVDVVEAEEDAEYVAAAVPWGGGVAALVGGPGFGDGRLVTVGTDPPLLPEGATAVGVARVDDRLMVGVLGRDEDSRVLVYDPTGALVADLPAPFSPWSLVGVGDLAVGTDPHDMTRWVSPDGERWMPIPVDPRHGFPGVETGGSVVPTEGDLIIQGVDRGQVAMWRWTGPRGR